MGETRPVLDIASLLVTAAVPRLVDALVSGRGVGSDDAGGVAASAVEELLGTVLKAQDQTAETLARLEQKLFEFAPASLLRQIRNIYGPA